MDGKRKETYLGQLPEGISLARVVAYCRLRAGVEQVWGETHILVHDASLLVLTRNSVMDAYRTLVFPRSSAPRLDTADFRTLLVLTGTDGSLFRIPVSKNEVDAIERLLAALESGSPNGTWPPRPTGRHQTPNADMAGEAGRDGEGSGLLRRLFSRKKD